MHQPQTPTLFSLSVSPVLFLDSVRATSATHILIHATDALPSLTALVIVPLLC